MLLGIYRLQKKTHNSNPVISKAPSCLSSLHPLRWLQPRSAGSRLAPGCWSTGDHRGRQRAASRGLTPCHGAVDGCLPESQLQLGRAEGVEEDLSGFWAEIQNGKSLGKFKLYGFSSFFFLPGKEKYSTDHVVVMVEVWLGWLWLWHFMRHNLVWEKRNRTCNHFFF